MNALLIVEGVALRKKLMIDLARAVGSSEPNSDETSGREEVSIANTALGLALLEDFCRC